MALLRRLALTGMITLAAIGLAGKAEAQDALQKPSYSRMSKIPQHMLPQMLPETSEPEKEKIPDPASKNRALNMPLSTNNKKRLEEITEDPDEINTSLEPKVTQDLGQFGVAYCYPSGADDAATDVVQSKVDIGWAIGHLYPLNFKKKWAMTFSSRNKIYWRDFGGYQGGVPDGVDTTFLYEDLDKPGIGYALKLNMLIELGGYAKIKVAGNNLARYLDTEEAAKDKPNADMTITGYPFFFYQPLKKMLFLFELKTLGQEGSYVGTGINLPIGKNDYTFTPMFRFRQDLTEKDIRRRLIASTHTKLKVIEFEMKYDFIFRESGQKSHKVTGSVGYNF